MNILEYAGVGADEKPLDRIVTDGGFCSIFRSIGCIGDSLSSGEFESLGKDGAKGYHDYYEYSWGQFIARSAGCKVYNFSRGGMTAKEYVESFAEQNGFWETDKLCQAYIIALGVNDLLYKTDFDDRKDEFVKYYTEIVRRMKELQPRARFFLVTAPRENNEWDENRKKLRDVLEGIQKSFDKTYLIDLYTYAPVYDETFKNAFYMGHMTPTGYVMTAKMIESYIDYIIRKNPKDFKQVGFIGTDLYFGEDA